MKFCLLLLLITFTSGLYGQSDDPIIGKNKEVSTDISGVFFNRMRVDYNQRFREKLAFSVGLQTRNQLARIEVNDIPGAPFASRNKSIEDALRFLDARVGLRWYLGILPDRGIWIETSALVNLVDWQSREYKEERETSIYPMRYKEQKTAFGAEAAVGYRYVFKTGLSLSAQVTATQLFIRDTIVNGDLPPAQSSNEYLDFRLGGSLLTVGYVW